MATSINYIYVAMPVAMPKDKKFLFWHKFACFCNEAVCEKFSEASDYYFCHSHPQFMYRQPHVKRGFILPFFNWYIHGVAI